MVLNSESRAGGPQILDPIARYVRSSFGTLSSVDGEWTTGIAQLSQGSVCNESSTCHSSRRLYTAFP